MLVQTVEIQTMPVFRWCSYSEDIVVGGNTYQGGAVAEISDIEFNTGTPEERANIAIAIPEQMKYDVLTEDSGPVAITVGWAKSSDHGQTWTASTRKLQGQLSLASIEGGSINLEVETLRGDVDRGGILVWSHEAQQDEYPGDLGLEYTRQLAGGEIDIGWPP